MKFSRLVHNPCSRCAVLLLCVITGGGVPAAQSSNAWVRVYGASDTLRAAVAGDGINYGSFIWMHESKLIAFPNTVYERIQTTENAFNYRLDGRTFDPMVGFPQTDWFLPHSIEGQDFRLVQFSGPIKGQWLDALRASGVEPIQAIHPFSYVVWGSATQLDRLILDRHVRWAGEFLPAFRVPEAHRLLGQAETASMALVHAPTAETVLQEMRQLGAKVKSTHKLNEHLVVVNLVVSGDRYLDLANLAGVYTLQRISQDAGLRSETSQQSIVGNYDINNTVFPGYLAWLTAAGLSGDGVRVGIVDAGIFDTHPDLIDNMVACTGPGASCSDATSSHGTHVAGAVAGSAATGTTDTAGFLRGQGVAPSASLIEQRYEPLLGGGPGGMSPEGMLIIYRDSAVSGAVLSNNSWGPTGTPQGYDIPTMEIDIISRDADPQTPGYQPVLAVWSIMNGGGDGFGACSPSSLGSPDEAKNLFAVGSTVLYEGAQAINIFDISGNSAHGPACDGRLVPHIVAPGCSTDSPDSATGYGFKCGTSMASPIVSGAVALFWERYRTQVGSDPSPALVKAAFSAIAINLAGMNDADNNPVAQRPNRTQGWGRIDLDAVVNPPNAVWMYDQQLVFANTGQQFSQLLTPENPSLPVRLMLVWTDAPGPGMGGTTPAWVNDLDLTVTDATTTYLGYDFGTDGFAKTGGAADGMNNMEAIFLRPDQHNGVPFTLTVTASNLAGDALNPSNPTTPTQDFALVCYNCAEIPVELLFSDDFEG